MRTRGVVARKDEYAPVACASLCSHKIFCPCSIIGTCFLWNCSTEIHIFNFLTCLFMPRNIAHRAQRELERTVKRLRAFCATKRGDTTPESLWTAVEENNSAAIFVFYLERLLRLNRKTRHSLLTLKGRPERGASNFLREEFFNLYKIMRLRCTTQHQDEDAPGFASIGRQNRCRLRRTGRVRLREETMKQQSTAKMLETWLWMQNRQVCVWIDNRYIKQYGTHPTIQDQWQNCTALCVVEILRTLPYFRGHPTIDVLIGGIGSVAAALVRMQQSLCGIPTDLGLLADRPAPIPSIRAPLDIVRDPVPNPGWRPLLLTTQQVSTYKGLVEVLDYIASLSNHTYPIVPFLVDDNIHKRCLKLLYCDRTQR